MLKPYNNIINDQDLQDEMEDMLDIANEVQDTLGRTYGMPDDVDDADLEAGECCYTHGTPMWSKKDYYSNMAAFDIHMRMKPALCTWKRKR